MKKILSVLFLLLIIQLACKETRKLSVNYKEEVSLAGNMIFEFEKDMVEQKKTNYWDTTQYLLFTPAIKGKFKWTNTRQLEFSPLYYLKAATEYEATVNQIAYSKKIKQTVFKFHTPYPDITDLKAYWATNQSGIPVIMLDIEFAYRIKPTVLKDYLTVELDGISRNFVIKTVNTAKTITLEVQGIEFSSKELKGIVSVKKGMQTSEGTLFGQDITKQYNVIAPTKLEVISMSGDHDGFAGTIYITMNQQIVQENISKYIDISPKIEYKISVDNANLIITSEKLEIGKTYMVTVKENLKGVLGGTLKYEYTDEVKIGDLNPSIKFIDKKASYLMTGGNRNIELNIINVPEVEVKITKVYENNIQTYLNSARSYYDYYYDSEEYGYDEYYDDYWQGDNAPGNLGDIVWQKDIKTENLPVSGQNRLLKIDFEDKIRGYNGLYVVEVTSKDDYWLKSRKAVSISDIGIIAKEGKNHISVFVNSIKSATPMPNVKLNFWGKNNQLAGTAITDADGIAILKLKKDLPQNFSVSLITAQADKDFNFLSFNKTRIGTSRFDVGGKTENLSGYDVFVYSERDIYRPGEKINIAAFLRDFQWKTPGEIPLIIKLITPEGKNFKSLKKELSKAGAIDAGFELPVSALTGTYNVEIYTSNNVLLASKTIMVEEFMPDRIKFDINFDKKELNPGEDLSLSIEAFNLFGPPAANRDYEIEQLISKKYFSPKGYSEYNFNVVHDGGSFENITRSGKTDSLGKANEDFDFAESYREMGILQARYYVTVFDETGRPVHRQKSIDVYTQQTFIGLKYPDYYNRTDKSINFEFVALDKNGKQIKDVQAIIQVVRHDYKTVLAKDGSYFRYKSEHEEIELVNEEVVINGTGTYRFTPKESGQYDVYISGIDATSRIKCSFYAYGYGRTSASSFKVNTEGQVDIELDKESYSVGDKAKVIMKNPFAGKILVTVESNEILEHFYIETDKRAASFDLQIKPEYVPNVYITATLFRPHKESDLPVMVGHGFAPVIVLNKSDNLPIEISATKKTPSKTKQTISVKSAPNTELTIAVVDEGILQVTGFKTPDPYGFFYQKRCLGVASYDVYPYLFPEIISKTGRQGGGDFGEMDKRVNPMKNKRVKLVSFWSGLVKTNASGTANFQIDIPQFSGELRVMAVAHNGKSFGSNQSKITVADPIVISSGFPRFLSPKDTVDIIVTISNTTTESTDCIIDNHVTGPIKIIGSDNLNVKIKPESEKQIMLKCIASHEIGEAKVAINVQATGKKYTEETEITVRPASPLQKISGSGSIAAGSSQTIQMQTSQFMPFSVDKKLIISTSPVIQFTDHISYLLKYPYGCLEQTVAAAFPQIYYSDLAKTIFSINGDKRTPNYNVQEAIRKIKLMQLYNGGMTYWSGTGAETWWGTAFAVHFLIEAKKAGFEVEDDFLKMSLNYLEMKLKEKKTVVYYYNYKEKKEIAPHEVPYSLYVLALAGKPKLSTMNYYKANRDLLTLDGKYLLAATYALAGDKDKFLQIIPAAFNGEISVPVFGGSFYSPIRDIAITLNAILEVDPDNQQIGIIAKHLSESIKKQRYMNTQEHVWTILALGKIAKKAAQSNITADIKVDGKDIGTFKNQTMVLKTNDLKGNQIDIATNGNGNLFYFWEAEGISKDGSYKEEDSFLKIRRTYFDRDGKLITNNTFRQGDIIVVKLSITGDANIEIDNVVITDILPAGFEIENPRLTDLPAKDWIKDKSFATYSDIRDDRINLFTYANASTRNFYYLVRAVTPGIFQLGPVGADAMYNGEYHSYHGAGIVRILKK